MAESCGGRVAAPPLQCSAVMPSRYIALGLVGFSISGGLGCVTTRYMGPVITPVDATTIQQQAGDTEVVALLAPPVTQEPPVPAKLLAVAPETTRVETPAGASISVPTADVRVVVTRDRSRGLIDGLCLGVLAGAAIGAGAGYSVSNDSSSKSWGGVTFPRESTMVFGTFALGALGGVLGAAVGAVTGHQTHYVFGPAAP